MKTSGHGNAFHSLGPIQKGRHFADDVFKCIFFKENVLISIEISPKFVPKRSISNIPALVQIVAWCRTGDKPLSEPKLVSSLTHICVTRLQWVNWLLWGKFTGPPYKWQVKRHYDTLFVVSWTGSYRTIELPDKQSRSFLIWDYMTLIRRHVIRRNASHIPPQVPKHVMDQRRLILNQILSNKPQGNGNHLRKNSPKVVHKL